MTEPNQANKAVLEERFGSLTTSGMHVTFFDDHEQVGYVRLSDVKRFDQGSSADFKRCKSGVREAEAALELINRPVKRKR